MSEMPTLVPTARLAPGPQRSGPPAEADRSLTRLNAQLSSLVGLGLPMHDRRRGPGGAASASAAVPLAADDARRQAQVLDLLDYGVLRVAADGRVLVHNRAARSAMAQGHPLQIEAGLLHVRCAADAAALREAIGQAAQRGLRKLLALTGDAGPEPVAVVPLQPLGPGGDGHEPQGVALLLARREVCEPLSVEWFARCHGLTMAETAVVKGLCADLTPQQIAQQQGVGLATVRTQIGAIRGKTGACSIRALLRQVALLPPMVSVLQVACGSSAATAADRPSEQAQGSAVVRRALRA